MLETLSAGVDTKKRDIAAAQAAGEVLDNITSFFGTLSLKGPDEGQVSKAFSVLGTCRTP